MSNPVKRKVLLVGWDAAHWKATPACSPRRLGATSGVEQEALNRLIEVGHVEKLNEGFHKVVEDCGRDTGFYLARHQGWLPAANTCTAANCNRLTRCRSRPESPTPT